MWFFVGLIVATSIYSRSEPRIRYTKEQKELLKRHKQRGGIEAAIRPYTGPAKPAKVLVKLPFGHSIVW